MVSRETSSTFRIRETKSNMSWRTRNIVQRKCENARKLHTYVIFVLSKTEKTSHMHRIIRRKTQEKGRSENAKNLDVSRETPIFRVQQDVVESTTSRHPCVLTNRKVGDVSRETLIFRSREGQMHSPGAVFARRLTRNAHFFNNARFTT